MVGHYVSNVMHCFGCLEKGYGFENSSFIFIGCYCYLFVTSDTNDGGAVNDKQLRDFMNSYSIIPTSKEQMCDAEDGICEDAQNSKFHISVSYI